MRQIYIVNATQVVTSDTHPEGVYSAVTGYPIRRDSLDYERTEENPNGNEELALIVAQADYADAVKGSTSSCLIGELAKMIAQNGYPIGEKRLFQWLRDNHYLCSYGEKFNQPYSFHSLHSCSSSFHPESF